MSRGRPDPRRRHTAGASSSILRAAAGRLVATRSTR